MTKKVKAMYLDLRKLFPFRRSLSSRGKAFTLSIIGDVPLRICEYYIRPLVECLSEGEDTEHAKRLLKIFLRSQKNRPNHACFMKVRELQLSVLSFRVLSRGIPEHLYELLSLVEDRQDR